MKPWGVNLEFISPKMILFSFLILYLIKAVSSYFIGFQDFEKEKFFLEKQKMKGPNDFCFR